MTLNEAIKMFEENADECQRVADTQELGDGHYVSELYCDDTDAINDHLERCRTQAKEHKQLAEWLKDYKRLKEQEPILDKIRAEIKKCYCTVTNDYDHGRNYGLYMATQIIDKYKTESEES